METYYQFQILLTNLCYKTTMSNTIWFRHKDAHSHPPVFMGDWFQDPHGYQNLQMLKFLL